MRTARINTHVRVVWTGMALDAMDLIGVWRANLVVLSGRPIGGPQVSTRENRLSRKWFSLG